MIHKISSDLPSSGMTIAGWISAAHRLDFTGTTVRRATIIMSGWRTTMISSRISASKRGRLCPFTYDFFWNFPGERTWTDNLKTIKLLKTPKSTNSVTSFHSYPTRPLQMLHSVCLPGMTWRKRAQTGSFTPNAADGQPRLGVT